MGDRRSDHRIGQRLIESGLITAAELDDALRMQVVHGARIGTNLVEHCELDLDALTVHLAAQHNLPPALASDFEGASADLQRRVPAELAARWLCVPLGLMTMPGGGQRVVVAARDALPEQACDELGLALGIAVTGAMAAELRIFYYLEFVYGFERPNRFKRIRREPSIELPIFFEEEDDEEETTDVGKRATAGLERRRFVTTLTEVDESGEPSREVLARIPIRRASNVLLAARDPDADLAQLTQAVKAIKRATGRDKVGDIVVEALRRGFGERFDVGMVLVLREGIAIGWKGFVRDGLDGLVELVAVPMDQPSSVAAAVQLGEPYVGAPMEHSTVDKRLWQVLEVLVPGQLAAVPVELFGQLVCVIYAHCRSDGAIDDNCRAGLTTLGDAVQSAFERLTRAAQR